MGNIFRSLSSYFIYEREIIYMPIKNTKISNDDYPHELTQYIFDKNKNYDIYKDNINKEDENIIYVI
jgi:hypothetical protein